MYTLLVLIPELQPIRNPQPLAFEENVVSFMTRTLDTVSTLENYSFKEYVSGILIL